ncbi:MAG: helicase-related protein [Mangrovibacterium sp.]
MDPNRTSSTAAFVQGTRIHVRGEDFLIQQVSSNYDGSFLIDAEGISELVKGKRFKFDSRIDADIRVLDPAQTELIADTDYGYRRTKLFLETQLRNSTGYSKKINIAHKAAFNLADYQLDPTLQAFKLPRPRLLIADGVGLGKTIEVGILLAELIKRGKGKRIMVLALKSILGQFQQEIWNRFAIPLVRLDSEGIAHIKAELPANKNPFEYYDKTIISIDTLKNNAKFRHYIEKTSWDIIVVDECHTVANAGSQRGDVAQFLATRCESLILTSATPHNGKKQSFANLINMIEPTAVPANGEYVNEDFKPYYVRRFKRHIMDDAVRSNFQDREVVPIRARLSAEEEELLEVQQKIKFESLSRLDEEPELELDDGAGKGTRDLLFSIGLFKGFMSSPLAAVRSIERRIDRIKSSTVGSDLAENDIQLLLGIRDKINAILDRGADSKYRAFRDKLIELGWSGRKNDQRIVVFTERIDTLHYLEQNLKADFNIEDRAVKLFHGGLPDMEQQAAIEDFGKEDSDVRLFLSSDAGSQGVNLHYYCNVMFNYDIPWSLITLEQRNGRIDRYGQKKTPWIYYLIAQSETPGVKTDLHIIENLTKKEEEVYKTLGDAGAVMKLYSPEAEEKKLEEAIAGQNENFLIEGNDTETELFDTDLLFGGLLEVTESRIESDPIEKSYSLYPGDYGFYSELIAQLKTDKLLKDGDAEFIDKNYLEVRNTKMLNRLLYDLPREAKPAVNDIFRLSFKKEIVQQAIDDARKKKGEWAKFQLLYDLHPVARALMSKLESGIDKQVALVARLKRLPERTAWFVIHGQVSNNIGQAIISEFFVVPTVIGGGFRQPIALSKFVEQFQLNKELITQTIEPTMLDQFKVLLPEVVEFAREMYMRQIQMLKELEAEKELAVYQEKLKNWGRQAKDQLQADFGDKIQTGFIKRRFEDKEHEIETIISESSRFYQDLTSLNKDAYLKIISVFYN